MTTNDEDFAALFAVGYAAAHQLPSITLMVDDDLDTPARVYHDTNTIVVRSHLPIARARDLIRRCVGVLCQATVVERDDGEGTEWATDVAASGTHGPRAVPSRGRPDLRLV